MKQERGAESLFFQQASEAILKQSHEEAFTFLEKGLAIARGGGNGVRPAICDSFTRQDEERVRHEILTFSPQDILRPPC